MVALLISVVYELKYFTKINYSAVMKHKIGSLASPIDDKAPDELDYRCYVSIYLYISLYTCISIIL